MGRRGPAPQPTAIKRLRGNPGHRPLNDDDQAIAPELPEPPEELSPAAREVWFRFGHRLREYGLITSLDEVAFTILCEAYANYLFCLHAAKADGQIVRVNGQPVSNPYLARADKEVAKIQKMLREFGLTPAARASLHIARPDKDEEDEFGL